MATAGSVSTTGRCCRHPTPAVSSRPRLHRARLQCRASYQTEASIPPRPPPPPPPPPQGTSRRGLLQQFGGLGAAAALGGVLGYFAGSHAAPKDGGLTAAERAEVDDLRKELNLRRDYGGHVYVRDGSGGWWEVRLDAKLPGTMLLRDPEGGVHFLTYNNLQQIDLTDDYVMGSLFAGGEWLDMLQRVQARDDAGEVVDLRLDREAFRDIVSIMD